ncbi:MAG: dihydrolipoamide succinyltransferase, partial [Gammaproteobacteria bacterium]
MTTEIRVPQLPESIADATLVAWHKQPGDAIARDENLADLETDKVVLEVPAPANGVVRELRVPSGTVVTSGQVLALIEEGAAAAAAPRPAKPAPAAKPVPAAKAPPAADSDGGKDAGKLSPSVRRLVEENHLDPSAIPGSGRDGRLTKSDVVGFLGKQPAQVPPGSGGAAASAAAAPAAAARAPAPRPPAAAGARAEQRVPMTRLRARIAQRLVEA